MKRKIAVAAALAATLLGAAACGNKKSDDTTSANGAVDGIAALTTDDGRATITMPHPERVYRSVQNSWHPRTAGEDSGWMRMFRNARKWVG